MKLTFLIIVFSILLSSCAQNPSSVRKVASTNGNESGDRNDDSLPSIEIKKLTLLYNGFMGLELELSHLDHVKQVVLKNKRGSVCGKPVPDEVLSGSVITVKGKFQLQYMGQEYCDRDNFTYYNSISAIFENGEVVDLSPFLDSYTGLVYAPTPYRAKNFEAKPVKIEARFNNEVDGEKYKTRYGKMLPTKNQFYDISYSVSASDLTNYKGVIFENGEGFLSDDAMELADFINSKKHKFKVAKVQSADVSNHLCFPFDCLLTTSTPIKDKFELIQESGKPDNGRLILKLIKKEESKQYSVEYAYKDFE